MDSTIAAVLALLVPRSWGSCLFMGCRMNYLDPDMSDAWDRVMEAGYITVDMNVPISVVVDFIRLDERHYNRVEEELQIEAVKAWPGCLEYMGRPSKAVVDAAIKHTPANIGRIKKPTKEAQLMAVQLQPNVIELIMKPCAEASSLATLLA